MFTWGLVGGCHVGFGAVRASVRLVYYRVLVRSTVGVVGPGPLGEWLEQRALCLFVCVFPNEGQQPDEAGSSCACSCECVSIKVCFVAKSGVLSGGLAPMYKTLVCRRYELCGAAAFASQCPPNKHVFFASFDCICVCDTVS